MSSPEKGPTRRVVLAGLGLAALAATLAGCQVRPLYADRAGAGPEVTKELAAVAIKFDEPRDNDDRRRLQALRNDLIFAFTGGGGAPEPRYELRLFLSTRSAELGIEQYQDVPAARMIAITATFTLTDLTTRSVVMSGTSFANASYDFSSQRFANIRAERDAENRAVDTLARNIQARVATALATR